MGGAGEVITAARSLYRGESSDNVLGVMGADFPLRHFYRSDGISVEYFVYYNFFYASDEIPQIFAAVLPKRLYKTHTPCIHYRPRDKTHRFYHGLIKRSRQTPSLLTLSPFPFFSSLAFTTSFLPPVLISIFSISWAMFAVTISFCNQDFMGCNVFDIRSGHIYFQGQYSLYFFPFVCSVFLVIFFALVVFVFNAFLLSIFLQPPPGCQSYKGV